MVFLDYTSVGVGFPGIGIEEFRIDRSALKVFGHDIMWYGIIITLGMILAVTYVILRSRSYKGICADDIIDFAIFMVLSGVVGARLYYVLTSGYDYDLAEAIAIWEGGLAIYGGIIGGGIALLAVCRYKKFRPQCLLDMCTPAVMLGQMIGRWGNFCNGEAFGSKTESFIRMELTHYYPNGMIDRIGCVHPTFLYESLWNLAGFILLNVFYKKRKFDGQIALGYFAWYGFGRMLIEGLRTDSLYVGSFRISQVVGAVSLVCAITLMFILKDRAVRYDSVSMRPVPADGGKAAESEENGEGVSEDIDVADGTDGSDGSDGSDYMYGADYTDGAEVLSGEARGRSDADSTETAGTDSGTDSDSGSDSETNTETDL